MGWTIGQKPDRSNPNRVAEAQRVKVDIGAARAAQIAAQFGETRVVLSFASLEGGAMFVSWLRQQIMEFRGYSKPNHVYVDTTSLALVPETSFVVKDARRTWRGGVASMNGGWRGYYRNAITQAHTMIFVGTEHWSGSQWCRGEYEYFVYEAARRQREKLAPLTGVVLRFPDCTEAFPGLVSIACEREYAEARYEDSWQVNGSVLLELMRAVGRP